MIRAVRTLVPTADDIDEPLRRRLAREAHRRITSALRRWEKIDPRRAARLRSIRRLIAAILSRRDPDRDRFLSRGEIRTWLCGVEDALDVARAATAAGRKKRRAGGTPASWSRLMDLVADAGELAVLAPRGKLPPDFPRRALSSARRILDRHAEEFPLAAIAALPPGSRRGRFRISFGESVEMGRPGNELRLAGAGWSFLRAGGGSAGVIDVRLTERHLLVSGRKFKYPTPPAATSERIVVGVPMVSEGRRLALSARNARFDRSVKRALALLAKVWPEAALMVTARTWLVVPIVERGTVSFSSARRPGVSYINIRSRPLVRLAEDLLHEATHERLHEIESIAPLVALPRGGEEEARFYSPWRRDWRPLRGLLHAGCTFVVGARFFERMLRASDRGHDDHAAAVLLAPSRRNWLARRLVEEMENVRILLKTLRQAIGGKALTPTGRQIALAIGKEYRALLGPARARAAQLSGPRIGKRLTHG